MMLDKKQRDEIRANATLIEESSPECDENSTRDYLYQLVTEILTLLDTADALQTERDALEVEKGGMETVINNLLREMKSRREGQADNSTLVERNIKLREALEEIGGRAMKEAMQKNLYYLNSWYSTRLDEALNSTATEGEDRKA